MGGEVTTLGTVGTGARAEFCSIDPLIIFRVRGLHGQDSSVPTPESPACATNRASPCPERISSPDLIPARAQPPDQLGLPRRPARAQTGAPGRRPSSDQRLARTGSLVYVLENLQLVGDSVPQCSWLAVESAAFTVRRRRRPAQTTQHSWCVPKGRPRRKPATVRPCACVAGHGPEVSVPVLPNSQLLQRSSGRCLQARSPLTRHTVAWATRGEEMLGRSGRPPAPCS